MPELTEETMLDQMYPEDLKKNKAYQDWLKKFIDISKKLVDEENAEFLSAKDDKVIQTLRLHPPSEANRFFSVYNRAKFTQDALAALDNLNKQPILFPLEESTERGLLPKLSIFSHTQKEAKKVPEKTFEQAPRDPGSKTPGPR
jgi:hypothetical protein